MRLLLAATVTTVALLPVQRPAPVSVPIPGWAGPWSCRVQPGDIEVAHRGAESALIPCADPQGKTLQCDFDRAEPLDVPLDVACRTHAMDVRRAARVKVEVAPELVREPMVVSWLALEGLSVRELASRALRQGELWSIPVSASDDRLIRFHRATGQAFSMTVTATDLQRATPVRIQPPGGDVGAIEATLQGYVCGETTRVSVSRSTGTDSGTVALRPLLSLTPADCRVRIDGLPPGRYRLVALGRSGRLVSSYTVALKAGEVTTVAAAEPPVMVYGEVLLNGRAPADSTIVFYRDKDYPRGLEHSAAIGAAGAFEVRLPESGTYRAAIRIGGASRLGKWRVVDLKDGANRLDWWVNGGAVRFEFRGSAPDSPVDVRYARVSDVGFGDMVTAGLEVNPKEPEPHVLEGLDFGSYEVQARQVLPDGRARVSDRVRVALTETVPEAHVVLTLREYQLLVTVTDDTNKRAGGADVTVGGHRLAEVEAGTYETTGRHASPGDRVHVRASRSVPSCQVAPPDGQLAVRLSRGQPREVAITTNIRLSRPGGRIRWPGTECSVGLSAFEYQQLPQIENGTYRFLLKDFPAAAQFEYFTGPIDASGERATVSADGVLRLHAVVK